ncbi:hypothetical protein WMY93_014178 [Mugilogobius chulae]|uniref:Uncharacterized protein n=1 Tax=Mugilogobius chulae TaxID=88201 RepID=A0AAW0NUU9_9GOBI
MIVNTVGSLHSYPNGRPRPYSLALGRKIKQRLWEKLNRPLVSVIKSVGDPLQYEQVSAKGPFPPFIEVDISGEPQPEKLCVQKQEQEQTRGLQAEQPRSSSPEPEDEPRRKRPFQVPAQNPEETLSHGSLPRSSSPKPEEEPQCKRPFQSVVAAQSHEEPPSQRSLPNTIIYRGIPVLKMSDLPQPNITNYRGKPVLKAIKTPILHLPQPNITIIRGMQVLKTSNSPPLHLLQPNNTTYRGMTILKYLQICPNLRPPPTGAD